MRIRAQWKKPVLGRLAFLSMTAGTGVMLSHETWRCFTSLGRPKVACSPCRQQCAAAQSCASMSIRRKAVSAFQHLRDAQVLNPEDGQVVPALDGLGNRALVVVMPQLGDFDSAEYAEFLSAVTADLDEASVDLRVIGIGGVGSALQFSNFTGLPIRFLRVDPTAEVHGKLGLHRGPGWDVPDWFPTSVLEAFANMVGADVTAANAVARAWLNYMAMCAGIAAPGTLAEILRGYVGDRSAPERLAQDEIVRAGPIAIRGARDVKIGPIEYQNFWKDEEGYQRPIELATVRLRAMVEVLSNFGEYVPDQQHLDFRGATYIFEDGQAVYEYRDRGVLTYSETMPRPLLFLEPYIGRQRAQNPLNFADIAARSVYRRPR